MFNFIEPMRPFGGALVNRNASVKGHLQTLIGHFAKSELFSFPTEFIKLKLNSGTGNYCGLHISVPFERSKKVLLLFHGLGGSGQVFGDYTEPYHSGRGEDVSDVLDYSKNRFSDCEQIVLGVSMSGTIILNLLTGRFGKTQPDRAIVINAPLNLHDASARLQNGFSQLYDWRFYYKLKKMILKKEKTLRLPRIGNTATIDELFTSKKSGFRNKNHYYDECSPYLHLNRIKTRTYVLTSADDPIVSYDLYKKAQWPDSCRVHISSAGGHVGYYSNQPITVQNKNFGHRWLDYFLFSLFQTISSDNRA